MNNRVGELLTINICSSQEGAASIYTLADGGVGDWFGSFLYSAGQDANVAVQDQLSALSFTRFIFYMLFQSSDLVI